MRYRMVWIGVAAALACSSPPPWDDRPPRLVATALSADGRELDLEFDEPVNRAEALAGPPPDPAAGERPEVRVEGARVKVPVTGALTAGKDYRWTAQVEDARANTTEVAGRFYGPNDHPARLRLNELRVAGTGPHPDFLELRVEGEGSLGGWTLEYRETGRTGKLILEDREVASGTLVLVYRKAPTAARHPEAAAGAVVLVWPGDEGFSGVRGAVLLRPTPTAEATDRLAWAATPGQGKALAEAEGVDEVDPTDSTATRTWCRSDSGWVLVANGSATPGGPNKLKAWEPPPATPKPPTTTKPEPGARKRRRSGWPAFPWTRSGRAPGADGEAEGPAVRASGPRSSLPPGLRGSRVLPLEPRRRTRVCWWERVPEGEEDGAAAGEHRPVRRR